MFIVQHCTIGKRKTGKNVELIFISAKIHSSGIHSITSKRKILRVLLTDSFMQRQSSATPDYTFDYTGVVPDPVCPVRAERRSDPHQGEAVRLRAVGAGGLQTKQVFVESGLPKIDRWANSLLFYIRVGKLMLFYSASTRDILYAYQSVGAKNFLLR